MVNRNRSDYIKQSFGGVVHGIAAARSKMSKSYNILVVNFQESKMPTVQMFGVNRAFRIVNRAFGELIGLLES